MLVLAVKALLAPFFVVSASLAARRFGPWLGGVVGGLPVVAAPILLAYALVHGRDFGAHAAAGTLLGLISLTCFVVIYGRLSPYATWFVCMLVGWAGFGVATVALDGVNVPRGIALIVVIVGFGVALRLLPKSDATPPVAAPPPPWDLPVRAIAALVLVLALTTASSWLGPQLSGLLAPFPIITTVLATFTHHQRGPQEAVRLLRGMLIGFGAYALFCFCLSVWLRTMTIAEAFGAATALAVVTQSALVLRLRASGRPLIVTPEPGIPARRQA